MTLPNRSFRFAASTIFFRYFFSSLCCIGVVACGEAYSQQSIRSHQLISGKKEIKVQAIVQDAGRIVWIGTESGLIRYNGISYMLLQEKDGLPFNSVTALHIGNDSTLWIGHANGKISLLRNEKFSLFNLKDTTSKEKITCIVHDSKDHIWIGTYGTGAYKYDGKNLLYSCYMSLQINTNVYA